MSIPDTVGEHDITKGDAHFLSSLKYRGQLYSKVYGQATPSTIGQMTAALTEDIPKEHKLLQAIDEQAANDYLDLMVLLCGIISKSDGDIDLSERMVAEDLFYRLTK